METKVYTIGQICSRFRSGKNITADAITETGVYPVYGGNGLRGYTSNSNFKGECSIIGRQGAYCGNVKYFEGEAYMSEHAIVAVTNKEHDNRFFSYKLGLLNLGRFSGQAAQPGLSVSKLSRLRLEMPPLSVQRKISSTISNYDSQIENNQKRIKLLEQMAENLYKEWFVRFRFPGYEKENMKPSKYGRIPVSFDVKTMGEVFEYYIGGGWGEEQQSLDFPIEASVIRGADFPNVWHFDISSCPKRYHKISNYKSRQLEPGDIVFEISGGTSEQPVGRAVLATKELIDRFQDKHVICASFCKLIRINKDVATPYYFYYWLKYLYNTRIIDRFQLQSTGIINFKFESFLKKGTVVLPPMDIMKQFDDSVEPLYCEMNNLAKQNDLLTTQRDLLLPRLMSGKLSI